MTRDDVRAVLVTREEAQACWTIPTSSNVVLRQSVARAYDAAADQQRIAECEACGWFGLEDHNHGAGHYVPNGLFPCPCDARIVGIFVPLPEASE